MRKRNIDLLNKKLFFIVLLLFALAINVTFISRFQNIETQNVLGTYAQGNTYTITSSDSCPIIEIDKQQTILECIGQNIENKSPLLSSLIPQNINTEIVSNTISIITIMAIIIILLDIISTSQVRFSLLNLFKKRTSGNSWGIILDASNNKPIRFAIIKLYRSETTQIIDQTISDNNGNYGFPIEQGEYRIEVTKNTFETFTKDFKIFPGQQIFFQDIKLIPLKLKSNLSIDTNKFQEFLNSFNEKYNLYSEKLFKISILLSIINLIISFTLINTIITGIIVAFYYIYTNRKYDKRSKYGSVIDSNHLLRLPNVLIKIFRADTLQLVDTKISNNEGLFDFWGEPGEYLIHASIRGYNFPSKIQRDLPWVTNAGVYMLKLKLKNGGNRIRILVDPI